MASLLSLECEDGKAGRKEGENKKVESTYREDNKESCQKYTLWSLIGVCSCMSVKKKMCLCQKFKQAGSNLMIHSDSQRTLRSKFIQTLPK